MNTEQSTNRRNASAPGWLLLVALVGLVLSGCGRDEVRGSCQTDGDCKGSRVCASGYCTFGSDVEEDTTTTDTAPDGDDADTTSQCRNVNGMCVREDCSGGPDASCQQIPCPVDCEPWTEQTGCSCEPTKCNDVDDCDGYACDDGACSPCKSDEECGDGLTCLATGMCAEGPPCETDNDCPARQQCNDEGECIDRDECVLDDDCEEDEICFNGRCTFSPDCEGDNDCRDGMECIGGQCYEQVCRGHDDCEGDKLCDAGECVDPPEAARCFIATRDGKISENQRIKLEAFAVDQDGNGVSARFNWTSSKPAVAKISGSGDYAVGGTASGTTDITAEIDGSAGTRCQGSVELTNLGDVGSKQLRVVVTATRSGRPITGADIVLASGKSAQTNGSGVATLARPSGSYGVSIFHPDYNYVTIQGVSSPDIRVPLNEKTGTGPVAGFKGEFDKANLHTTGDITLGLAGRSFNGGLLEVGLPQLLGQPFSTEIQTPMGNQSFPLPSGLIFYGSLAGFDLDVKKKYYATGPGGAGIGWGLAGEVPGRDLIQLFQGGGLDNPLAVLLPLFNRFDHSARPMMFNEMPRVTDMNDIDGDGDTSEQVPDYQNFPKQDLKPSVRQNLVTEVSVSNFPSLQGGQAEFAMLVGGNLLNSAGLVPLGISATTDQDEDGFPDLRNLSMAPPHGAIAGGRYAVMALAFRTDGLSPQGGLELPDDFSAALWTKQTLPKKVGLGTFPNATQGSVDTQNRKVSVTADAGPMYRFQFVGQDRTWELWSSGPMGSMGSYKHSVTVPKMTGGRTDLFANGEVLVDAIQVRVGVNDLVKATGVGLRDVGLVATSFNRSTIE